MNRKEIESKVDGVINENYEPKNPIITDCDELSFDLGIEDKPEFAELLNNEFGIKIKAEMINEWDHVYEVYDDIDLLTENIN
jgi:hypothetical protein